MIACCWCTHYAPLPSIKWTFGERNVSGGVAWCQVNSKFRCKLKQEELYPKNCDFMENAEKVKASELLIEEMSKEMSLASSGL